MLDVPRRLFTVARDKPFDALVNGEAIIVTPATGQSRRITRAEFEAVAPKIVLGKSPGDLQAATFNSSYLEAIVHYLRRHG